jgi:UDP-glucose 4-epimerase
MSASSPPGRSCWAGHDARVVVTGGTGYIGQHLVARLIDLAATVTVADLAPPAQRADGVRYLGADLRDCGSARDAVQGADIVFHLAGNSDALRSVADPLGDFEANALATLNVARGSVQAGVKRIVYLSSALVYGRQARMPLSETFVPTPTFPYSASKLAGENILESFRHSYQLEAVIGRAFVVYGGRAANMRAEVHQYLDLISRGRPVRSLGDPDLKTRDFIHVDDVAAALLLLAEAPADAGVVNIGTGAETSLRQLAGLISELLGRPGEEIHVIPSPEDEFRQVADTTRMCTLGFTPATTLRDGIAQLIRPSLPAVSL